MTPFEMDLLKASWPFLSMIMTGIAVWYLKSVSKALSTLSLSIGDLKDRIAKVEKDITSDLTDFKAKSQHRFDRLLGESESRLGKIETVCELQHGIMLKRRSSDHSGDWAQESDVSGDKLRK